LSYIIVVEKERVHGESYWKLLLLVHSNIYEMGITGTQLRIS
jgi:hypothetical protein